MESIFSEIEYFRNHFPEIALRHIPRILIVVLILQLLLLAIHHSRKSDGTENGKKSRNALVGLIVAGWILLLILIGAYGFFYYTENIVG